MVALVVLVGIASAVDFDALWTRFHQVAFRNDLWLLDPTRDYLIMLFPEPFWFAATIRMATSVAVQTLLVALVGAGFFFGPRLLAGAVELIEPAPARTQSAQAEHVEQDQPDRIVQRVRDHARVQAARVLVHPG